MLKSEIQNLPSSAELPCSDETPVDNEEQNYIPNFLLSLLEFIWRERQDWFFGVDMAVYHTTGKNPRIPVIPDGFLALNVERQKGGESRSSYVVWVDWQMVMYGNAVHSFTDSVREMTLLKERFTMLKLTDVLGRQCKTFLMKYWINYSL